MKNNLSIQDKINLSFDAHFNLVSVHPFYDGNGRTSRLLMNYIQAYYDLPLAIINSQDRDIYFQALIDTREKDDINYFRNFMKEQYGNHLKTEIEKFQNDINPSKNRGFHFLF
jgi:Fic family protein